MAPTWILFENVLWGHIHFGWPFFISLFFLWPLILWLFLFLPIMGAYILGSQILESEFFLRLQLSPSWIRRWCRHCFYLRFKSWRICTYNFTHWRRRILVIMWEMIFLNWTFLDHHRSVRSLIKDRDIWRSTVFPLESPLPLVLYIHVLNFFWSLFRVLTFLLLWRQDIVSHRRWLKASIHHFFHRLRITFTSGMCGVYRKQSSIEGLRALWMIFAEVNQLLGECMYMIGATIHIFENPEAHFRFHATINRCY